MSSRLEGRRTLGIAEIMEILPHRYPFLLVDRVLDLDPGRHAVGIKMVTMNEEFFVGHFPGHPIMPAVLITEFMAQVGGIMLLTLEQHRGKLAYFTGIDKEKFRRPVSPGDMLMTRVELIGSRGNIGKVRAACYLFRMESCDLETQREDTTLASLPRNAVSSLVEPAGADSKREKRILLGAMEGELAAEGELMFAIVQRDPDGDGASHRLA